MKRKSPPPIDAPTVDQVDQVEEIQRVAVLEALREILRGHARGDVAELLEVAHPEVDGERIVQIAFDALAEVGKESPETRLGFCLEAVRELYRLARDAGDYAVALSALREIAKLGDAYGTTRATQSRRRPEEPDPTTTAATPDRVAHLLQVVRSTNANRA